MSTPGNYTVDGYPGWIRIETRNPATGSENRQYQSPEGTLISNARWKMVKDRIDTQGYFPEDELRQYAIDPTDHTPSTPPVANMITTGKRTPDGSPIVPDDSDEPITPGEFVQPKLNPKLGTRPTPGGSRHAFRHANNTYPFPQQQTSPKPLHRPTQSRTRNEEEDDPMAQIAADNKPRPRDRRSSHTRPTAAALSIGIKRLILLITSVIIVRILDDERAKMTEQEATMLSIALGNLLEHTKFNEQWGWIISETGDWQTLGYVLFMYLSRVGDVVREKQQSRASSNTTNQPTGNQFSQQPQPTPVSNALGLNGSALRMNVSSTPIVHPPQQ